MPWVDGEPPKDGEEYVVETINYRGPLVVKWYKYNGVYAYRDWDTDYYDTITRWHDLEGAFSK